MFQREQECDTCCKQHSKVSRVTENKSRKIKYVISNLIKSDSTKSHFIVCIPVFSSISFSKTFGSSPRSSLLWDRPTTFWRIRNRAAMKMSWLALQSSCETPSFNAFAFFLSIWKSLRVWMSNGASFWYPHSKISRIKGASKRGWKYRTHPNFQWDLLNRVQFFW